ncbi:MAG: YCF48-related protein [Bacteroidota bacterium]|nr:YCF48-related protein [Bacteroidota bacterium]
MRPVWHSQLSYILQTSAVVFQSHRLCVLLVKILVICCSCQQSESVLYQLLPTETSSELTGIYFNNSTGGILVGGETWKAGIVLKTNTLSNPWASNKVYDKEIFCLSYNAHSDLWCAGIDKIYNITKDTVVSFFSGDYRFYRGIDISDDQHILMAGGEAFRIGYIESFDRVSNQFLKYLEIDHELDAIAAVKDSSWIACGFGIILRSEDHGFHWDTLPYNGDHFRDIFTLDQKNIFIVGISGNILHSNDGGYHFTFLRKSSGIFTAYAPLRAVAFKNVQEGLVSGESGLVWKTENGGKDWIRLEGLPEVSYLDIFVYENVYFLCGSNGTLIQLKI